MSDLKETLRITILGAGMGGLSSALALAKQGFRNITVYEAASRLGEVGAGINMTPNLARVLDRYGVLDVARSEAVEITRAQVIGALRLLVLFVDANM